MRHQTIDPDTHGLFDHLFALAHLLAPTVLGLRGPARALCYGFAAATLAINSLTDHRYALARVIPFRRHGELETPFFPLIALLPWLTGASRQPRANAYFALYFALGAANYLLTDYTADEPAAPRPLGQRLVDALA